MNPVELDRLLVAIAGQRPGTPAPRPERELSNDDFAELLDRCESERLLGALGDAIERGDWDLSPESHDRLKGSLLAWMSTAVWLEKMALQSAEALDKAGIPCRVLKGVALARLIYEETCHRIFVDLDLLVPSDRIDEAADVFESVLGGQRAVADVQPGFTREFGKDVTITVDGLELDLHRVFVAGPFGLTMNPAELFTGSTPIRVGSTTLQTLAPTGLLLHGCFGAALGDYPPRLGSLRDLLLLIERWPEHLPEVIETAQRWQAEAVVLRAAEQLTTTFDLNSDHPAWQLAQIAPPLRQRILLRTYTSESRSYWRQVGALAVIPGIRRRVRYMSALIAPSTQYLQSRGWTETSHIRRALRHLRGRPDE